MLLFTVSCNQPGSIRHPEADRLLINGKVYRLIWYEPDKIAHGLWIMYPEDSLGTVPTSLGGVVTTHHGKHSRTIPVSTVIVD